MIRDDDDLERAVENFVLDKAEPAERRAVEDALRGHGAQHANVTELLRFERAIEQASQVQPFGGDVVSEIQKRMQRELSSSMRHDYQAGLAAELLRSARADGRFRETPRPHRPFFTPARVARAASIIVFIVGFYSYFIVDLVTGREAKPYREQVAELHQPKSSDADEDPTDPRRRRGPKEAETEDPFTVKVLYDRVDDLPRRARYAPSGDFRLIADGETVVTDADNGAFVRLPRRSGHVVLMPDSQLVVERAVDAVGVRVRLMRGAIRVDVERDRPLFLRSRDDIGADGRITGQGEVTLVGDERSITGALPGPQQTMVVRIARSGYANFAHRGGAVEVGSEEIAVLGPNGAVTFTDDDLPSQAPSTWPTADFVARADEAALTIGDASYSRGYAAREALRYFGAELIDHFTRTMVIEAEIAERGLEIPLAVYREAEAFVDTDEVSLIAPLRSEEAIHDRKIHCAGLLTLAYQTAEYSRSPFDRRRIRSTIDQMWRAVAQFARIDLSGSEKGVAFTIQYHDRRRSVTFPDVWNELRRLARPSEIDAMFADLVKKKVVAEWVESRGVRMAPSASSRAWREIETALARLAGISRQASRDRQVLIATVLPFVNPPKDADIEKGVQEFRQRSQRVDYERYFVPIVATTIDDVAAEESARRAAEKASQAIADQLRGGVRTIDITGSPTSGLWRSGFDIGPRPWWNEVYGKRFGDVVATLSEGSVSAPIFVGEGYMVVSATRRQRTSYPTEIIAPWVRANLLSEAAQRMIDELAASKDVRRMPTPRFLE